MANLSTGFHLMTLLVHILILGILSSVILLEGALLFPKRSRHHRFITPKPIPCHNRHASAISHTIDQIQDHLENTPSNEFHIEKYEVYKQFIQDVLASPRVSRRETNEDLDVVARVLLEPTLVPYFPIDSWYDDQSDIYPPDNVTASRKQTFINQLRSQRDTYMNITGISTEQYKLALKALNYLGDTCAKRNASLPLFLGWTKVKELGVMLQENALSTYLYVLTNSNSLPSTISTDQAIHDWSNETDTLLSEIAGFHDLMYQPCEKTVTLRIKSYIDRGDVHKAERLLDTLPKVGGELRLRTCVPILDVYCRQNGDMASALKLYKKMKESSTVLLESEIFSMLISSLAAYGYFCPNAAPINGAQELGYTKGPELLNEILRDMAEDVVEISNKAATEIRNGFVQGFQGLKMSRNLERVPWDCQLFPVSHPALSDELVACRVTVDERTGQCPRSQTRLKLMVLSQEDRRQMYNVLLNMAESQFESYDAKLEAKNQKSKVDLLESDFARNELQKFAVWLDEREGDPFTAIVDGANVAYFGSGSINYGQIKLMVTTLEKMGERPLVVMPQKYVQEKFYIRKKFIQVLSQDDLGIINDLIAGGKLYIVPQRCLDDYYWVLSSLSDQARSRNNCDLNVLPNDSKGRWPGVRPFLITNDLMRDHKLELLQPRLFWRWFSSHIVNYNIIFNDGEDEERKITFTTADFFSREIQSNPTLHGTFWHFPVQEWERDDRFCLRIPVVEN